MFQLAFRMRMGAACEHGSRDHAQSQGPSAFAEVARSPDASRARLRLKLQAFYVHLPSVAQHAFDATRVHLRNAHSWRNVLADWFKALASGTTPKGRGPEPNH